MHPPSFTADARAERRPVVLSFVPHYLPGYRYGGPVRTLANMVERLSDEFEFRIVTRDRDYGALEPYPDVQRDAWNEVGNAQVFYASPQQLGLRSLRRLLCETPYDLLYLNSFFEPTFTIKPLVLRRLGWIPERPTIVVPRGELGQGALSIKPYKKAAYLDLASYTRLYDGVVWHASSEFEEKDILRMGFRRLKMKVAPDVVVAPNLPAEPEDWTPGPAKKPGEIRIVSVCRVCRMKNVAGALRYLAGLEGTVQMDILGPIEDEAYWQECLDVVRGLPPNVTVTFRGPVDSAGVREALIGSHLFLLPTLGENFGHAITEAFSAGVPVVISNRTPWRNLHARQAGWDIPLEEEDVFRTALQAFVDMDLQEYLRWVKGARKVYAEICSGEEVIRKNLGLFHLALDREKMNPETTDIPSAAVATSMPPTNRVADALAAQ